MKGKKLNLKDFEVKSFITSLSKNQEHTVLGGHLVTDDLGAGGKVIGVPGKIGATEIALCTRFSNCDYTFSPC